MLIKTLEKDKENIDFILNKYCSKDFKSISMEQRFRVWAKSKQNLFKLFNNKLILEKPIVAKITDEILDFEICSLSENYSHFFDDIWMELGKKYQLDSAFRWNMLFRHNNLLKNELNWSNTNKITINPEEGHKGKPIILHKGEKLFKALKKIIDNLINNPKQKELLEMLEQFRIDHSKIFNQKEIKGTLCLSIHPLDYITMSDNTYDWSSCMSWEDGGCYRSGTLEMMNSPIMVVAYLKRNSSYENWNSKVWRQLFVCSENIIAGIKAYPYYNESLSRECASWLRELRVAAQEEWDSTPYSIDFSETGDGSSFLDAQGMIYNVQGKDVSVTFSTQYMYNDCYLSEHVAYLPKNHSWNIYEDMSGNATCIQCGEYLTEEDFEMSDDSDIIRCGHCDQKVMCKHCGRYCYEEELIDGLCERCQNRKDYYTCKECGSSEDFEENLLIYIKKDNRSNITSFVVCEKCYNKLKEKGLISKTSFYFTQYITLDKVKFIKDVCPNLAKKLERKTSLKIALKEMEANHD